MSWRMVQMIYTNTYLTLACRSKILARLLITSWILTWIQPIGPSKTSSITMAPTVNFGCPKFAKMIRPCDWRKSVLSHIWNSTTETWLFSVLHLISARGLKCSIMHPTTPPSPMFSIYIW
jgi:hypothetical protein